MPTMAPIARAAESRDVHLSGSPARSRTSVQTATSSGSVVAGTFRARLSSRRMKRASAPAVLVGCPAMFVETACFIIVRVTAPQAGSAEQAGLLHSGTSTPAPVAAEAVCAVPQTGQV